MLRIINIPSPTAVNAGGTGLSSYAVGDLIYASGATALSKLADVATGSVLVSGGVGAAPAWASSVSLSGTLSASSGLSTASNCTANAFGVSTTLQMQGSALNMGSGYVLKWYNAANWNGNTNDLSLVRAAAGVLQITDGSTGIGQVISSTATIRQSGGVAGTDEVQISHDGTNAIMANMNDSSGTGRFLFNNASAALLGVVFANARFPSISTHQLGSGGVGLGSSGIFSWSGNTDGSGTETSLGRAAANSVYLRGDSTTGVGPTFQLQGKSSTTSGRVMWDEVMTWTDSTDASRKAKFVGSVYDTAAREAVRYEADGTQALISFGGGAQFKKLLSATASLDFGATAVANGSDLTITVTGAAVGDSVMLGTPASHDNNSDFDQWVSAADTVTVRFNNYSNASINPASGTFRATVFKF